MDAVTPSSTRRSSPVPLITSAFGRCIIPPTQRGFTLWTIVDVIALCEQLQLQRRQSLEETVDNAIDDAIDDVRAVLPWWHADWMAVLRLFSQRPFVYTPTALGEEQLCMNLKKVARDVNALQSSTGPASLPVVEQQVDCWWPKFDDKKRRYFFVNLVHSSQKRWTLRRADEVGAVSSSDVSFLQLHDATLTTPTIGDATPLPWPRSSSVRAAGASSSGAPYITWGDSMRSWGDGNRAADDAVGASKEPPLGSSRPSPTKSTHSSRSSSLPFPTVIKGLDGTPLFLADGAGDAASSVHDTPMVSLVQTLVDLWGREGFVNTSTFGDTISVDLSMAVQVAELQERLKLLGKHLLLLAETLQLERTERLRCLRYAMLQAVADEAHDRSDVKFEEAVERSQLYDWAHDDRRVGVVAAEARRRLAEDLTLQIESTIPQESERRAEISALERIGWAKLTSWHDSFSVLHACPALRCLANAFLDQKTETMRMYLEQAAMFHDAFRVTTWGKRSVFSSYDAVAVAYEHWGTATAPPLQNTGKLSDAAPHSSAEPQSPLGQQKHSINNSSVITREKRIAQWTAESRLLEQAFRCIDQQKVVIHELHQRVAEEGVQRSVRSEQQQHDLNTTDTHHANFGDVTPTTPHRQTATTGAAPSGTRSASKVIHMVDAFDLIPAAAGVTDAVVVENDVERNNDPLMLTSDGTAIELLSAITSPVSSHRSAFQPSQTTSQYRREERQMTTVMAVQQQREVLLDPVSLRSSVTDYRSQHRYASRGVHMLDGHPGDFDTSSSVCSPPLSPAAPSSLSLSDAISCVSSGHAEHTAGSPNNMEGVAVAPPSSESSADIEDSDSGHNVASVVRTSQESINVTTTFVHGLHVNDWPPAPRQSMDAPMPSPRPQRHLPMMQETLPTDTASLQPPQASVTSSTNTARIFVAPQPVRHDALWDFRKSEGVLFSTVAIAALVSDAPPLHGDQGGTPPHPLKKSAATVLSLGLPPMILSPGRGNRVNDHHNQHVMKHEATCQVHPSLGCVPLAVSTLFSLDAVHDTPLRLNIRLAQSSAHYRATSSATGVSSFTPVSTRHHNVKDHRSSLSAPSVPTSPSMRVVVFIIASGRSDATTAHASEEQPHRASTPNASSPPRSSSAVLAQYDNDRHVDNHSERILEVVELVPAERTSAGVVGVSILPLKGDSPHGQTLSLHSVLHHLSNSIDHLSDSGVTGDGGGGGGANVARFVDTTLIALSLEANTVVAPRRWQLSAVMKDVPITATAAVGTNCGASLYEPRAAAVIADGDFPSTQSLAVAAVSLRIVTMFSAKAQVAEIQR